ncbi:MAG: hypothetical protein JWO03_10 [Bacteroidetes bacterium]|nr:hypothetical protein [Bacteroidota bacterium]
MLLLLLVYSSGYAQRQPHFSFDSLFAKYPYAFDSVIAHKEDYRLQLLYTRIDRDANNIPHLTTYSYDADRYYYYCASMMKLPACALTLEKLNNLSKYRVNMLDSLAIDTVPCTDLSPETMMLGTPYSLPVQYIKEMLLVSNNHAFNPIYDFLGQYDFQERLRKIGYPSAVISNRYAGCDTDQNRRCDPVSLFDRKTHQLKYTQPCIINQRRQFYEGELSPLVGNAYLGGGGVINEPKSFRFANYIKLSELHKLLTKIIFPQTQSGGEKLNLTHSDYQYLYKCMGMFPRECAYPAFDSVNYPDNYMKYFIGIDSGSYTMPANIRIFNKVGQAYGFMTDCSYVMDTLNKVEFFLSCAMYLNADGILNDGKYEYDQIGYPFFHSLFNGVYSEELTRHKDFTAKLELPDFSDTLLVKPTLPKWMRVDSTATIADMERSLCTLYDTMFPARSQRREELITLFGNNLAIVLRQQASYNYSFGELSKRITIVSSPDQKLCIFQYLISSPATGYLLGSYVQNNDTRKSLMSLEPVLCQDNSHYPDCDIIFDEVKSKKGVVYYLRRDCGSPLFAYSISGGKLKKEKIFQLSSTLTDNVVIADFKCDKLLPRVKRRISFKVYETGKKAKQLRFDGTIFK